MWRNLVKYKEFSQEKLIPGSLSFLRLFGYRKLEDFKIEIKIILEVQMYGLVEYILLILPFKFPMAPLL